MVDCSPSGLIREHRSPSFPGTAFGMTDGCYFRVAYGALQKATVAEGIGAAGARTRVLLAKPKSELKSRP